MSFDPESFINQTVSGPMSTTFPVVPEGEYKAIVSADGDLKDWFSEIKWKDKKDGTERSASLCTIPIEILDDALRTKLGREKVTSRIKVFLDMKDGKLDTSEGKNVRLGQLRAACGQNDDPNWNFTKLRGAGPFMARVAQTSDPKDPEVKYSDVVRVTKLS